MKKRILLLSLICVGATAQNIDFADPNLKAALVDIATTDYLASTGFDGVHFGEWTAVDTNGDGEIQVSEAAMITYLDLDLKGLSNLGGIEYFTSLIWLSATDNQLAQVDFTGNANLWVADLGYNALTSINVLGMDNLRILKVESNQLTALDITGLPKLESVNCAFNQLAELDFHTNPQFYDLGCHANNMVSLNIQNGRQHNTMVGIMWCDGWGNNPGLQVCADADEIDGVNAMLDYSYPTIDIPVVNCILGNQQFTNSDGVAVFPNPASDFVKIQTQSTMRQIQITDANGRILESNALEDKQFYVDLSGYGSGIYYLKITTETGTKIQKLLKK